MTINNSIKEADNILKDMLLNQDNLDVVLDNCFKLAKLKLTIRHKRNGYIKFLRELNNLESYNNCSTILHNVFLLKNLNNSKVKAYFKKLSLWKKENLK